MEFKEIVKQRYTVSAFDGRKVPEDKVNELLEIIRLAPSSYSLEPYKILVISDKALLDKLLPAAYGQEKVKTCSHLLVFCANSDLAGNIKIIEEEHLKNGSTKEGIKGYIDAMKNFISKLSPTEQLCWAQRQTYLALGNALNGAKSLGFDSGPMEGFSPAEFSKILNLPNNLVPSALCAIGYAADSLPAKYRLPEKYIFERR